MMTKNAEKNFTVRDAILQLLSDDELARVCNAECRPTIEGEDYVDLAHPELGVLKAQATPLKHPENILPRSAVRDEIWAAIRAKLA
jgi:hypothetical protein